MALHTYTPYEWKNAPDHKTTPLSADNLNHIEQGIKNAEDDIAEVNAKIDRGSVTVTANGVNTYSTMLNLLFANADMSKVSGNSYFTIDDRIYQITYTDSATLAQFSSVEVSSSVTRTQFAIVQASNSKYREVVGTNFTDLSSTAVTSGKEFTIHY